MKTRGIRGTTFALLVVAVTVAADAGPPVAQVDMSADFLSQFQMTGHKTADFYKNGRLMHPDISLLVKPRVVDGKDSAQTVLDVNIDGWSTTHSSKRVIFGKTVNVTVSTHIDADYKQPLAVGTSGLKEGAAVGTPVLTPHISSSNNFRKRKRNRKANGIAQSTASDMVEAQLPHERQELDETVRDALHTGVAQAKQMVDSAMGQANSLMAHAKSFPFQSSLSSKGGPDGSITMRLTDKGGAKPRPNPPKLDRADQTATTVTIHGDLLAETIGPEIAGQEMFLVDFQNKLCGPKTKRLLDFCQKEMPEDSKKASIVFAKEKPVEFFFDKGKIGIRLNAVYRKTEEKDLPGNRQLLNPPDRSGISFETIPYSVDIVYKLKDGEAHLDTVDVRDRNPSASQGDLLKAASSYFFPDKHDEEKTEQQKREEAAKNLSPVIKALLKQQLTDSMKPVMTFPSVSFPTKLYTPKFNDQPGEPTVMSAGSLVPVDVATKDGWLVVGNSFCSDAMPSLGVTMQQRNYQSGGASLWALQAFGITPGSPADQIGLKVGDVIDSFGVPGERAETVINGARDPFYAFIAERSKEKSPGKRTMEIGGRSVNGVPFKKTVTLCPSGMNHKDLAAKAMKEARAK